MGSASAYNTAAAVLDRRATLLLLLLRRGVPFPFSRGRLQFTKQ